MEIDAVTLRDELDASEHKLRRWVREGMPCRTEGGRRIFDRDAVSSWLVKSGHAKQDRPERTVESQGAVAQYFGVSLRSVSTWRIQGMPGEPGRYDLDAIEEWRGQQGNRGGSTEAERAKLLLTERRIKEIKLHQFEGQVIPIDPVLRIVRRIIGELKAYLNELPDMLIAHLPTDMPSDEKADIRQQLNAEVDQAYRVLSEMGREMIVEEEATEEEE